MITHYIPLSIYILTFARTHAVPPAKPKIDETTSFDRVSWSQPNITSDDERADNFTVTLNFTHNGTLAQQFDVMDGARWAELEVVPGMNYTVLVTAHNQDGSRSSEPHQFATLTGRKSQVTTLRNDHTITACILKYFCQ